MSVSFCVFNENAWETLERLSWKLELNVFLPADKPVNVVWERLLREEWDNDGVPLRELDWEKSGVAVWEERIELGVAGVREWRGVPERGVASGDSESATSSYCLLFFSLLLPRPMSSSSSSVVRSESSLRPVAAVICGGEATFSRLPFICIKIWKDIYQSAEEHAQFQTVTN